MPLSTLRSYACDPFASVYKEVYFKSEYKDHEGNKLMIPTLPNMVVPIQLTHRPKQSRVHNRQRSETHFMIPILLNISSKCLLGSGQTWVSHLAPASPSI